MRRLATTMAATALVLGSMVIGASAQTQAGAASMQALKNATPIVTKTACRGWGPYCPPGYVRACGPYRCWCRPCY